MKGDVTINGETTINDNGTLTGTLTVNDTTTLNFIIICATGRSGSTTLQRIINTIEDSNIRGENCGAINNLLSCYLNIKKTNKMRIKEYYEETTIKKPSWYNCYDFETVKNNIKNTILSILNNNDKSLRIIGFKEIRYLNNIYLIDEFIELFPNTKVICHIDDNLDRQSNSGWWKKNKNSRNTLEKYNKQLIDYCKCNPNTYLSYMKNLFDINEMINMFNFLEEKFNEKKYKYIIDNSKE
jgi:hypothetical protein